MARRVKFVANRRAFRQEILQNEDLRDRMQAAAEAVAPEGCKVTTIKGVSRNRTQVFDPDHRALSKEAETGHLSRVLNAMRL